MTLLHSTYVFSVDDAAETHLGRAENFGFRIRAKFAEFSFLL
jgi:hypothetical protein